MELSSHFTDEEIEAKEMQWFPRAYSYLVRAVDPGLFLVQPPDHT